MPPPRHQHVVSVAGDQLYLFGGQDELGAPSAAMFRLPVPRSLLEAGAAAGVVKGEWVELESELPFNKSRCALMSRGVLSLLQLGSTTLGRVNEDDAEKGERGGAVGKGGGITLWSDVKGSMEECSRQARHCTSAQV